MPIPGTPRGSKCKKRSIKPIKPAKVSQKRKKKIRIAAKAIMGGGEV